MAMPKTADFTIGPVDTGFLHLFETHKPPQADGDPKYQADFILDDASWQIVWGKICEVVAQAFPNGESNAPSFKWPFKLGSQDPKFYSDFPNNYILNAKASIQYPPQVVSNDAQRSPIVDRAQVYPGIKVYAIINVFSYSNVSKGIGIGLGAIMKVGDGEPFAGAGAVDVQKGFAAIPASAPAPTQTGLPAPTPAGAPTPPGYGQAPQAPTPPGYGQAPQAPTPPGEIPFGTQPPAYGTPEHDVMPQPPQAPAPQAPAPQAPAPQAPAPQAPAPQAPAPQGGMPGYNPPPF